MPAYLYSCPVHNEFEKVHSIKEKLEHCPKCKENNVETPVVRLITPSNFILKSGGVGWGNERYSG